DDARPILAARRGEEHLSAIAKQSRQQGSFLSRRGGLRRQRQPFVVVIGWPPQSTEILRAQLLFTLSGRREQQQVCFDCPTRNPTW
ncbi:unnamed protein product, partial [Ectocarpus sp. 12 AP-2014]